MRKPNYSYLLVGGCLLVMLTIASHRVLAQDVPATSSAPVAVTSGLSADMIFLKRFSSVESQRLIRLYQDQFELYRQTDREFTTAQAEYLQLGTLASLESAVVSSRKMMLDRCDVLITYHELLATTLVDSLGVELQLKQATLGELQHSIDALKQIRLEISNIQDRYDVGTINATFETQLVPQLNSVAYKTLSQLVVADLQSLLDKTKQVYAELKTELEQRTATKLQLEERKRAYTEVDAAVRELETQLAAVTEQVKTAEAFNWNSYQQLVGKLEKVYGGLGQVLTYIEELERDGNE